MPPLGNDGGDDDIVIGTKKESLNCPITTMLLEDPVTSAACKHNFSKDAIMQLIRRNGGGVRCPIPGCESLITANDLKSNMNLARKVERYIEKRDDVDDDDEYTNVD